MRVSRSGARTASVKKMRRLLILFLFVFSVPALSSEAYKFVRASSSNCDPLTSFYSSGSSPSSSLLTEAAEKSMPSWASEWEVTDAGGFVAYISGRTASGNFFTGSCSWQLLGPPVPCGEGHHVSSFEAGGCVPDCGADQDEDEFGKCIPKCETGTERGEDGTCQPMTPKTPGDLVPSNTNNSPAGHPSWEDSTVSTSNGEDCQSDNTPGLSCSGGHEYSYDAVVCCNPVSGQDNCYTKNSRYTGGFCGGNLNVPFNPGSGGGGESGGGGDGEQNPGGTGGETGGGETGGGTGGETGGGETGGGTGGETGGGETGGGGTGTGGGVGGGTGTGEGDGTGDDGEDGEGECEGDCGLGDAESAADGLLEGVRNSYADAMGDATGVSDLAWSFDFSFPAGSCQPIEWSVFGNVRSFDACPLLTRAREAWGFGLAVLCLIYLWRRATNTTGTGAA